MSSGPLVERQKSESLDIPPRRVEITDPSQLPSDFSTTPGGTIFSTTPGGTRIIYERKFLLQMQNSPLSRSPPKNMPSIPGVTLMKSSLSSPPISTSPQPPKVMSPAKKESDTALRQEGNVCGKSIACSNNVCTNVSVPYCM